MIDLNMAALPKKYCLLPLVFILTICIFLFKKNLSPHFNYFSIGCSIYDSKGILIFKSTPDTILCAFSNKGWILVSNTKNQLSLYDSNDLALWTSQESVHHDLKFTNDGSEFLAINSEFLKIENQVVRSDCFTRRNQKNDILSKWCLRDHLEDLKRLGYSPDFASDLSPPFNYPETNYEISHANSINQIENTVEASVVNGANVTAHGNLAIRASDDSTIDGAMNHACCRQSIICSIFRRA